MDYSIKIGGEAGQGIQTVGDTLTGFFSHIGFHVFTHQDYESRVRGGHNFYQIRISDQPISASRKKIDILVVFDEESVHLYEQELTNEGNILYDPAGLKETFDKSYFLQVPLAELAEKSGGNKIMANTVAVGAVIGMLGLPMGPLIDILKRTLKKKDEETLEINRVAANLGYEYTKTTCSRCAYDLAHMPEPKLLIGANEAIGISAIASGCKFYSAYPMTPSTGIMVYIAGKAKKHSVIVEQAEDEIAAINMALGASFAGIRSMTGTSGGGFALMVEGLSLCGITETPLVIALGQRPGPATGLPTRTEQGDLLFALHAGHGEFLRVIFAPGSPEEAFYLTNKAFDISQKYQIPVLILTDQYLADSQWTYKGFDVGRLIYNDYHLSGDEMDKLPEYKRHAFTDNGISPRGIPGESKHCVVTDSDEHNEEGHLIEDRPTRIAMVQKRVFKKHAALLKEIEPPFFYGAEGPEIVIVGWGSTYGIMKEVIDIYLKKDKAAAMLHFSEIYPFPEEVKLDYMDILRKAKQTICIEQNATSQFAQLMKAEKGYEFTEHINRYDGRPFLIEELLGEINGRI